jgi:hypothetical protein
MRVTCFSNSSKFIIKPRFWMIEYRKKEFWCQGKLTTRIDYKAVQLR